MGRGKTVPRKYFIRRSISFNMVRDVCMSLNAIKSLLNLKALHDIELYDEYTESSLQLPDPI